MRTKVVGHRGARGLAPENTLASIRKALEAGVDEIEIDVRVTKDGVPVLHHNRTVRGPEKQLYLKGYTLRQLQTYAPQITTLAQALELAAARCKVLIEVKPKEPVSPVIEVISRFLQNKSYTADDLLIGSKSQKTLEGLHRALPQLATVIIESFLSVRAMHRARKLGTKRLSMNHHFIWSGFVRAMHRRGYELYIYTLNDPRKAERWRKRGMTGVITDFPGRFTE